MKLRFRRILAALLCLSVLLSLCGQTAFAEKAEATELTRYHTSMESAAEELRQQMELRANPITVYFALDENSNTAVREVFMMAFAHTGVPTQGDYLRWQCGGCDIEWDVDEQDGQYLYSTTYTVNYYTTAKQEERVDQAVEELLAQLDLDEAGDYRKVCAIYDYICSNVDYDHIGIAIDDKQVFTAYGALVSGLASCQGYAVLFYRLALELGLDARLVPGTGRNESHAWNIVKLGEKYYNLDTTWDAGKDTYSYFLECDASFTQHTRKSSFDMDDYPIAEKDYWHIQGDFDESGAVTDEDAIYLLWHTLFEEDYPISQTGDVDLSGTVTDEDAIYLLWHTLFEEEYPLK